MVVSTTGRILGSEATQFTCYSCRLEADSDKSHRTGRRPFRQGKRTSTITPEYPGSFLPAMSGLDKRRYTVILRCVIHSEKQPHRFSMRNQFKSSPSYFL